LFCPVTDSHVSIGYPQRKIWFLKKVLLSLPGVSIRFFRRQASAHDNQVENMQGPKCLAKIGGVAGACPPNEILIS